VIWQRGYGPGTPGAWRIGRRLPRWERACVPGPGITVPPSWLAWSQKDLGVYLRPHSVDIFAGGAMRELALASPWS
jgi:hypothetical protein